MNRINVRPATPDLKVPTGAPNEYFAPDMTVEVDDTRYIRRRIADGDLVEVPADAPPKPRRPQAQE